MKTPQPRRGPGFPFAMALTARPFIEGVSTSGAPAPSINLTGVVSTLRSAREGWASDGFRGDHTHFRQQVPRVERKRFAVGKNELPLAHQQPRHFSANARTRGHHPQLPKRGDDAVPTTPRAVGPSDALGLIRADARTIDGRSRAFGLVAVVGLIHQPVLGTVHSL